MSHYDHHRQPQEATVPVSFSPQEGAPGTHERRENRLIVGIALGSGLMLGLVGVVLFQLTLHLFREVVPSSATGGACSGDNPCPEGFICQEGLCLTVVLPPDQQQCQPNDTCGTEDSVCTCEAPSTCENNSCIPPKMAQSSACDHPKIQEMLTRVAEQCKGNINKCPPDKLKTFALASADFDKIIQLVPETISLHFPEGKPQFSPAQRSHYLDRMRDLKVIDSLKAAKVTLIIGRASAGGTSVQNDEVSRMRADFAYNCIETLIENTDNDTYQHIKATQKKLILGNRKILQPSFFKVSHSNRLIAWTNTVESALLSNLRNFDQLSRAQEQWTRKRINQVTLVVPIACALPGAIQAQPQNGPEAAK